MSPKSANNSFAKSMNLIDAYLFKHGHILSCGHHAEEGSDIGKACTMGGCGSGGISGSNYGTSSLPSGSSGIHQATQSSSSSGGATGSGTYIEGVSPQEGGFRRSADPVNLINRYLDKQSRHKCGHKKGDPNHLEAA